MRVLRHALSALCFAAAALAADPAARVPLDPAARVPLDPAAREPLDPAARVPLVSVPWAGVPPADTRVELGEETWVESGSLTGLSSTRSYQGTDEEENRRHLHGTLYAQDASDEDARLHRPGMLVTRTTDARLHPPGTLLAQDASDEDARLHPPGTLIAQATGPYPPAEQHTEVHPSHTHIHDDQGMHPSHNPMDEDQMHPSHTLIREDEGMHPSYIPIHEDVHTEDTTRSSRSPSSRRLSSESLITVTAGLWPREVQWSLSCTGQLEVSGGAPFNASVTPPAIGTFCTLTMSDAYGDGWNGAEWSGLGQQLTLTSGEQELFPFFYGLGELPAPLTPPPLPPSSPPTPSVPPSAPAPRVPPLCPPWPLPPPLLPLWGAESDGGRRFPARELVRLERPVLLPPTCDTQELCAAVPVASLSLRAIAAAVPALGPPECGSALGVGCVLNPTSAAREAVPNVRQVGQNHRLTLVGGTPVGERAATTVTPAWADMDLDGDMDLAVVNAGGPNELFENREGRLERVEALVSANASDSRHGVWGDVDGDGRPDLLVVNWAQPNELWRNTETGFEPVRTAFSDPSDTQLSRSLSLGDVDGDGHLDILEATFGGTNRLYLNDGGGGFTLVHGSALTRAAGDTNSMALGDADGDGLLDVLVANWAGTNQLFFNLGNGRFEEDPASAVAQEPADASNHAAWADFDGDGNLDLVVSNWGNGNKLYRNTGNGTLELVRDTPVSESRRLTASMAWADVDADGDLDLIAANFDAVDDLYRNDGGVFVRVVGTAVTSDTQPSFSHAWADMDGDGDLDLAVAKWGAPNEVYRNNQGAVDFAKVKGGLVVPKGAAAQVLALADADADADVDLLVCGQEGCLLYLNDGTGAFTLSTLTSISVGESVRAAAWGDYDGDGLLDLVTAVSGPNHLYHNEGGGRLVRVPESAVSASTAASTSVAWGDMDGDGRLDLVVGNVGPNELYRNLGDGRFELVSDSPVCAGEHESTSVAWADVDKDGDLDLAVGHADAPNELWVNGGNGNFTRVELTSASDIPACEENTASTSASAAAAASTAAAAKAPRTLTLAWGDANGDGWPDLAVGNAGVNQLYTNVQGVLTPTPASESALVSAGAATTFSLAWADVQGDGYLGLAVSTLDTSNRFYLDQGSGLASLAWVDESLEETRGAAWADVDGDGDLDLLVATVEDRIALYRYLRCPARQAHMGGYACGECALAAVLSSTEDACYECEAHTQRGIDGACVACGPGAMRPLGLEACVECEPGRYQGEVRGACRPCAAGSASTFTRSLECFPCPAGSVAAMEGASECTPCDAGSYSSDIGSSACTPCPAGGFCPDAGASSVLVWTPCPPGSFNPSPGANASDACTPCPNGTANSLLGSTAASACVQCRPGSYADAPGEAECHECAAGTFQGTRGRTECEPCPPGAFCPTAASAPLPCPSGSYSPATAAAAADACLPCPKGHYCSEGSPAPTPCQPGWFAANTSGSACTQCAEGYFQPSPAASACTKCQPGLLCPPGSSAELLPGCAAGTYSDLTDTSGSPACLPCPLGYSCVGGFAREAPCGLGLVAEREGLTVCELCPAGSVAGSTGLSACAECGLGLHQPNYGAAECLQCDQGTSSGVASVRCEVCDEGYYRLSASEPTTECQPCDTLEAVKCAWNATLATIEVEPNHWRHSTRTRVTYACRTGRDGYNPCVGGTHAGTDGDGYCAGGHRGPVCELCAEEDHTFNRFTAKCRSCADVASVSVPVITSLVVLALLLLALVLLITSGWQPKWRRFRSLLSSCRRLASTWQQLGMGGKLKQLIGFYQVVAAIPSTYDVQLPEDKYTAWVEPLEWPSLLGTELLLPHECWGALSSYRARLLLNAFWPWCLIVFVAAVATSASYLRRNKSQAVTREMAEQPAQCALGLLRRFLKRALPVTLVVTFLLVPSVSARIFKTFLCDEYAYDDFTGEVRRYLHDDYALRCDSGEYSSTRAWAAALIVLWPVGVPVMYALVLLGSRRAITHHLPTQLSLASRFLWQEYEGYIFWWEPVDLLRKITLTGFVLLVDETRELSRLLIALLVSIVFYTMCFALRPYKRKVDDYLAILLQFGLVLIFLALLLLKTCEISPEACRSLGSGDTGGRIFLFFVIFSFVLLLSLLALGVLALVSAARNNNPIFKLRETEQAPVLSLGEGIQFHLFLSHTWKSGQDQVAVIKRQLQLCLPGIKVFLDIEDLADTSQLEVCIERSAVVLAFVSKSYFLSENCLRELYAASGSRKPLILMRETDPAKGWLPTEQAKAECPADLRDWVFGGGFPLDWCRASSFQLVSLRLVAERLVAVCNPYVAPGVETVDLYYSNELVVSRLRLPPENSKRLFASPNNPKAIQLAKKLQQEIKGGQLSLQQVSPIESDYFLLYLDVHTFTGEEGRRLADEVRRAREKGVAMIMVHETPAMGEDGCPFARFFDVTPQDLLDGRLYAKLAIPLYPMKEHFEVSLVLIGIELGGFLLRRRHSSLAGRRARRMSVGVSTVIGRRSTVAASRRLGGAAHAELEAEYRRGRTPRASGVSGVSARSNSGHTLTPSREGSGVLKRVGLSALSARSNSGHTLSREGSTVPPLPSPHKASNRTSHANKVRFGAEPTEYTL